LAVDILGGLLYREQFFYADCIVTSQSDVIGYKIINGQPEVDWSVRVEKDELTDIFQNFSTNIAGSTYVGGEASAHGSCGFFYKKTGDVLNWALMSLDSEPFVSFEEIQGGIAFISSAGHKWVVLGDNIEGVHIAHLVK
jgi:hypothetical protein